MAFIFSNLIDLRSIFFLKRQIFICLEFLKTYVIIILITLIPNKIDVASKLRNVTRFIVWNND